MKNTYDAGKNARKCTQLLQTMHIFYRMCVPFSVRHIFSTAPNTGYKSAAVGVQDPRHTTVSIPRPESKPLSRQNEKNGIHKKFGTLHSNFANKTALTKIVSVGNS